jgi:Tol biopolymer transport system component
LLCIDIQESYASLLNLKSKQVTALRPASWGSFSPDGSMIVCGDSRDIGSIEVASGNARLVYYEPDANQWVVDAEITPDNKLIVFRTGYWSPPS